VPPTPFFYLTATKTLLSAPTTLLIAPTTLLIAPTTLLITTQLFYVVGCNVFVAVNINYYPIY
jgi:hypothetical protein